MARKSASGNDDAALRLAGIDPASIASDDNGDGGENGGGDGDGDNGGPAGGGGSDTGAGANQPVKRGRGRPKGSGNRASGSSSQSKAQFSADLAGIESLLLSLHTMAATVLKQPLLMLDESEAAALAKAGAGVARHYPMKASAQAVDWVNLIMCLGTVYGTRVVAMKMQQSEPPKQNPLGWGTIEGGLP